MAESVVVVVVVLIYRRFSFRSESFGISVVLMIVERERVREHGERN